MKVAIFQGPQTMLRTIERVERDYKSDVSTPIYGPKKPFFDWRHYMMIIFPTVGGQRESQTFLSNNGALELARKIKAAVYPAGSWEMPDAEACYAQGKWPAVRPDIIAEILGQKQAELAI